MVRKVRYSVWVALGWISLYLLLWILLCPLGIAAVGLVGRVLQVKQLMSREAPPWVWAPVGGLCILGWVRHTRRYWSHLFDRSPQLELHPTFLRAKQLDNDILWKEVQNISGSQFGAGWDPGTKTLSLSLVGGRRIELDLAGLGTGMEQLYRRACDARQADEQRRQTGESFDAAPEAVPPPEPVRTRGHSAGELGAEVEHYEQGAGSVVAICLGFVFLLGMTGFGYWVDPSFQTPLLLIMGGMGSAFGIPLILRGVKILRAYLVLCQNGLIYVGLFRRCTVRYDDILRTSVLSVRRAGSSQSTPVAVELILRDGQVLKLSDLENISVAGERIEVLRSAAACDDRARAAEASASADSPGS